MKIRLLTASLVFAPIVATAEQNFDALIDRLENFDVTQMDRDEYLDEMKGIFPDLSVASFLLFTRVGPELSDYAPDLTWSEAYDEAYGCMYDQTADVGNTEQLNIYMQGGLVSLLYLMDHPDLNFMTIDEHPAYMENVTPPEGYMTLLIDCGVQDLTQAAMAESGMMEALQQVATQ